MIGMIWKNNEIEIAQEKVIAMLIGVRPISWLKHRRFSQSLQNSSYTMSELTHEVQWKKAESNFHHACCREPYKMDSLKNVSINKGDDFDY